jgi:aspartyl-tRNA(Asn)/glutamyl-tRNA(Gln) amidotransferase subunit A
MTTNNALTIPIARTLFSSHRLTPSQLALYCHNVGKNTHPQFNAFSNLFHLDETLAVAAESDKRHRDGTTKGVLDGIPISIKCNISMKGKPLNASSDSLKNIVGYDSFVAKRLRDSGAILIGSTNMDEFGMGSLGNNCNTGNTTNPIPFFGNITQNEKFSVEEWIQRIESLSLPKYIDHNVSSNDDILSPGGSSSGSAVSVALGSSLASIGTDTGGS